MKTTTEKDLAKIISYFFDHFGEDRDFMLGGDTIEHELLEQIVKTVLQKIFKSVDQKMIDTRFSHFPKDSFIHGGCMLRNPMAMATVFYFEDIDTGVISIVNPTQSSNTEMVRFSCHVAGQGGRMPSMN